MRRGVAVMIALLVVALIAGSLLSSGGDGIEDGSVVVVELSGPLSDTPAIDALDQLLAEGAALPTLLLQLEKIAADERIEALLVHVRDLQAGWAHVQELRDALARVRAAGKTVVSLLDLESFNATRAYYLAAAADEVYVDPGILAPVAGIAGQYLFLAGLFERLGIDIEYARIGQYKSAVEMFANREMSAPAREMTETIINGVYAQVVAGIATDRDLSPGLVETIIDAAPASATEYVESGLADGIAGSHEVLGMAGLEDAPRVDMSRYMATDPARLGLRDGPRIALIFGDGAVTPTRSGIGRSFSADSITRALKAAAEDEEIEAVVFRINSPGGSPLASDQIWRSVRKLGESKPVIVSMAEAAASGGYYVASGADAILAQPATLTGSIGVFVLRPAFAGMYDKLDIGVEVIARGRHAGIGGSDLPLTDAQRDRTSRFIESAYHDFLERVAEGRDTDVEKVDALGRGYVWLGSDALEQGLVDGLGGLHEAVQLARERAGIEHLGDPMRVVLPGPRSLGEQLRGLLGSELPLRLGRAVLPIELPDAVRWAWQARGRSLSYLPAHWVHVY